MREQIIAEIRRLAAEIGRPPGVRHFQTRTGLAQHLWRGRYWARWSDALREAGLEPNPPFLRPHSDEVFEQLAVATRSFGRFPTGPELAIYRQTHPAPTALTLRCHFGGKSGAISRLRDWAAARPDYADVVALLPSPQALKRDQPGEAEGLLRLFRCRHSYRFVRTGESDDRKTWPPVAIPASATQEHAIRTDDPAGVEAYWTRRFAYRRIDPEWYALTAEDVAAFRRWKEI